MELRRLAGAEARDAGASGAMIVQGTTGRRIDAGGGLRLWAGEASDPFWIEPDVLAAIGKAFAEGARADLSSWDPAGAKNLFVGNRVYAIVLEVPDGDLLPVAGDDRRVGAYGTAEDPRAYGRSVADRIFPNVLPYTVGTPAVYGFAGWNGRSLTDNAPDVMFSLATNTALTIGLMSDSVAARPTRTFPYVPSAG
ncbi:hypothetical protein [Streptosporangium sp. OZ121]|uniref:hypothetical protein n=1 Tax=Streptosporangium sp. OZ121 TaxID=3444183 RepID=UPI003F7A2C0F